MIYKCSDRIKEINRAAHHESDQGPSREKGDSLRANLVNADVCSHPVSSCKFAVNTLLNEETYVERKKKFE